MHCMWHVQINVLLSKPGGTQMHKLTVNLLLQVVLHMYKKSDGIMMYTHSAYVLLPCVSVPF